jgi:hypothetical protein
MDELIETSKNGIIMISSPTHISFEIQFWAFIEKILKKYQRDGIIYNAYYDEDEHKKEMNQIFKSLNDKDIKFPSKTTTLIKMLADNAYVTFNPDGEITWDANMTSPKYNPNLISLIKKVKFYENDIPYDDDHIPEKSIKIYDLFDVDKLPNTNIISQAINKAKKEIIIVLTNDSNLPISTILSPYRIYQIVLYRPHMSLMDSNIMKNYNLYKSCDNVAQAGMKQYSMIYKGKQTYIIRHLFDELFFDDDAELFNDMDKYVDFAIDTTIAIEI